MPPTPAPSPDVARPRGRSAGRRTVGVLALLLSLVLTGCGVRLETPAPAALVPDELEVVRQRSTADALLITSLAEAAAGTTEGADQAAVTEALTLVADASQQHLDALGGVYDPGTDDATAPPGGGPSPSPSPTAEAQASPDQVAVALEEAAAVSRADATTVPDGPLARLLASITASRVLLAAQVRSAAGLPRAATVAVTTPETVPVGPTVSAVSALVQSEDAAGMAWEVYTARTDPTYRSGPTQRAARHRADAETWARLAEDAGAGEDPRRSAYDLPEAIVDPETPRAQTRAALADLEAGLAATYASLVAATAAGERSVFVDALVRAARTQVATAGDVPAFPGLPEQSA